MNKIKDRLFKLIRNNFAPGKIDEDNKPKQINGQVVILLTTCDANNTLTITEGRGKDIEVAVTSVFKTYENRAGKDGEDIKYLRLDILKNMVPLKDSGPVIDLRNDQVLFKSGLYGLGLGKNLDAIFLPEEVLMFKLIENKQIQVLRLLEILKNIDSDSAHHQLDSLKTSLKLELYRIHFDTWYIDKKIARRLDNGHVKVDEVNQEEIMEAIKLTKDNYFKKVVNKKGKFIYSYLPLENSKEKRYNILRHAGTVYSMLEVHEFMPDDDLLAYAERAIDYLVDNIVEMEVNKNLVAAVVEKDAIKLGGNALAIIALAKYAEVTGYLRYLPIMKRLAEYIKEVQNEEGLFTVHKQQYSTGESLDFISHYYPGEAILALVRLYQWDKNEAWLDVAERAAQYLINVRDSGADVDTIAHDHWLLYGLNELYRERKEQLYLDHAMLIVKAIMRCQIRDEFEHPDWNGAYYFPQPRLESTPTAIRTEGLCAAYNLIKDDGYDKEAQQTLEAIREGIRFQLQTQLRPESIVFYKRKRLCLGAFQRGLWNYDLRIDYTQHNISSLIACYEIINNASVVHTTSYD